jgi:hypothetical protein
VRLTLLVLALVGGRCHGHELLLVAGSLGAEGIGGLRLDRQFGCLPFKIFDILFSRNNVIIT